MKMTVNNSKYYTYLVTLVVLLFNSCSLNDTNDNQFENLIKHYKNEEFDKCLTMSEKLLSDSMTKTDYHNNQLLHNIFFESKIQYEIERNKKAFDKLKNKRSKQLSTLDKYNKGEIPHNLFNLKWLLLVSCPDSLHRNNHLRTFLTSFDNYTKKHPHFAHTVADLYLKSILNIPINQQPSVGLFGYLRLLKDELRLQKLNQSDWAGRYLGLIKSYELSDLENHYQYFFSDPSNEEGLFTLGLKSLDSISYSAVLDKFHNYLIKNSQTVDYYKQCNNFDSLYTIKCIEHIFFNYENSKNGITCASELEMEQPWVYCEKEKDRDIKSHIMKNIKDLCSNPFLNNHRYVLQEIKLKWTNTGNQSYKVVAKNGSIVKKERLRPDLYLNILDLKSKRDIVHKINGVDAIFPTTTTWEGICGALNYPEIFNNVRRYSNR